MATCDLSALIDSACSNKFICVDDEKSFRALLLQLLCDINNNGSGVLKYESSNTVFTGSTSYTFTHGLGATPSFVRAVFVCVANDAATGYVAGDEIDIAAVGNMLFPFDYTEATFSANSTTIFVSAMNAFDANTTLVFRGGGSGQVGDITHFQLKVYAIL